MKRKCLAWLLLVAMLVGMFGSISAVAATYTEKYAIDLVGTTDNNLGSNGGLDMHVNIKHQGDLAGVSKVVLVIDSTKLELINITTGAAYTPYDGATGWGDALAQGSKKSAGWIDEGYCSSSIYAKKLNDTQTIFRIEMTYKKNSGITGDSETTSEVEFALGFKTGYTTSDLDTTSLMVCDPEVGRTCGQTTIAVAENDGETYNWGTIDTSPSSDKWNQYNADLDTLAKPTITIDGKALPAGVVTLTGLAITGGEASINVPEKGGSAYTTSTALTVTGTYDDGSTAEVTDGTWTLCKDAAGETLLNDSDISINASTGAITVKPCAKAYTAVYAVCTKGTVKASKAVEIKRTTAEARTITLDKSTLALTIPSSGSDSKSVTASVTDQYGEAFSGTVTWGTPSKTLSGVTFSNGTVTVNAGATEGTFTVTASCGNKATATLTVNVSDVPATEVEVTGTVTKDYDGKTDTTDADVKLSVVGYPNATVTCTNLTYKTSDAGTGIELVYTSVTITDSSAKLALKSNGFKATGTINKYKLNPTVTVAKDYDGTTTGGTVTATATDKNGANVTIDTSNATVTFPSANVTTSPVTVTVTGLKPADEKNFTIGTVTATGTISAAAVTVAAKAESDIGELSATGWSVDDLIAVTGSDAKASTILGTTKGDDTNVIVKFYTQNEDGTYEEATPAAGAELYVGIEVKDGTYCDGGYTVTGFDTNAAPVKVKFAAAASTSSGGYTGGTTAPAPQEETPTVIDSFIKGYEDGTVGPNNSLTRAETAVIMARLSKGFDKDSVYYGSAPDVQPGEASDWYYTHVNYDIQKGIINGYPDGNFYPNEKITRAEFAAMLARFMGLDTTGTASFDDVNTEEYSWASGYVAALEKVGVVNGYEGSNDFKPGAPISRAEAIKMIVIALGVDTETAAQNTSVEVPSDLSTSHWAYKYIMAALSTDVADIAR